MSTANGRYGKALRLSVLTAGVMSVFGGSPSLMAGDLVADNVTVKKNLTVTDTSATNSVPTNGLALYYAFSSSATPVFDGSGNGRTGTVNGATWEPGGKTGGAYKFNGSTSSITLTDFLGTGPLTLSAWVYPFSPGGYSYGRIIDNYAVSFFAGLTSHYLCFKSEQSTTTCVVYEDVVPTGTWTHVLVTRQSNGVANFYVNGIRRGTPNQFSGTPTNGVTPLCIGNRSTKDRGFDGLIDELRIYTRVLATNEIAALYLSDTVIPGEVRFERGVKYVKPLGDLDMGVFTNMP